MTVNGEKAHLREIKITFDQENMKIISDRVCGKLFKFDKTSKQSCVVQKRLALASKDCNLHLSGLLIDYLNSYSGN